MIPCSYWALTWSAVLPSCITSYKISVRQTRDLPVVSLFPHPASFRFHLTMDTLAFGYILPTTRRIRDLHPLETCAAGRTHKKTDRRIFFGGLFFYYFFIVFLYKAGILILLYDLCSHYLSFLSYFTNAYSRSKYVCSSLSAVISQSGSSSRFGKYASASYAKSIFVT